MSKYKPIENKLITICLESNNNEKMIEEDNLSGEKLILKHDINNFKRHHLEVF